MLLFNCENISTIELCKSKTNFTEKKGTEKLVNIAGGSSGLGAGKSTKSNLRLLSDGQTTSLEKKKKTVIGFK